MITVRAKARGGIVVTSKMLLDNEHVSEFENHNDVVENMAKDAGFEHMLEKDCQGVFTSISQTFNRVVTMDELEEFEKRHQAWLKDVKGSIETEEMAAQQERERECPCHETAYDDDSAIQEKDIEFLKNVAESMGEIGLPFTADVKIQPFDLPMVRIGNRLLRILIADAIKKYVD